MDRSSGRHWRYGTARISCCTARSAEVRLRLGRGEGGRPAGAADVDVGDAQHDHDRSHRVGGRHQRRRRRHGDAHRATHARPARASPATGRQAATRRRAAVRRRAGHGQPPSADQRGRSGLGRQPPGAVVVDAYSRTAASGSVTSPSRTFHRHAFH